MRFLYREPSGSLSLTDIILFPNTPYAVLSHTWASEKHEVTLQQIQNGSYRTSPGATKLEFCVQRASLDGLDKSWVDTCCIDKTNHAELSEAITSMYRWYKEAAKCYVYLADVSSPESDSTKSDDAWRTEFCRSRWFRRGWTLQELLAPPVVEFYSQQGRLIGTRTTLESVIHEITGIPVAALRGRPPSHFTVAERFRWAAGRETTRVEDLAYCLVGMFGISMTARYGEGDIASARLQKKVNGQENVKLKQDLLNWLAPSGSHLSHSRAINRRHPGTNLLSRYLSVTNWLQAQAMAGRAIWITGKSGSGKTILFATIVEEARNVASYTPGLTAAYHYCTHEDPSSLRTVNILGSLVSAMSANLPIILQDLEEYFEADRRRGQDKSLETWELESIISRHAAEVGQVVFLVDGVNESEELSDTVACIMRLIRILPALRVLVTGTRVLSSLPDQQAMPWCEVRINNDPDILIFVKAKITNSSMSCRLSNEARDTITSTLIHKGDGSFRWVDLAVNSLSAERTAKNALSALSCVPDGLDALYAKLLSNIPRRDKEFAREALKWVLFAARPMTVFELSEAAVLTTSGSPMNEDSRLYPPEMILEICHGFLELDSTTKQVKVAHASVRDYLYAEGSNSDFTYVPKQVHRDLMRKCITYLLFDNFAAGAARCPHELADRQHQFPLLQYAAYHWPYHASNATEAEWDYAFRLLDTQSMPMGGHYGAWASCLVPYYEVTDVVCTEPLYYAASFGFTSLLRALLSRNPSVDVDHPGGRHDSTPLQVACFRGRKDAAETLFAAGANFWSIDPGSDKPPWFWAECNGWHGMVAKMLELRPDIATEIELTPKERSWAKRFQARYSRDREWTEHYQALFTEKMPLH